MGKIISQRQPNADPLVPDGEASMQVYLVRYDEYQWFRYDEAGHKFCYGAWRKKALDASCRRLVVQLVPDALFPRDPEKSLPYVYYQEDLAPKVTQGFKIDAAVVITLDDYITQISPVMRAAIERALTAYPNGTRYAVCARQKSIINSGTDYVGHTTLLEGKVQK